MYGCLSCDCGVSGMCGIPCVRCAPRPLALREGDGMLVASPLCPLDISPVNGGNLAAWPTPIPLLKEGDVRHPLPLWIPACAGMTGVARG